LKDVKPVFVAACIAMNRILKPFGRKEFLEFANLFIEGTHWEMEMHDFKVKQGW
jgi:hypothetical protein